MNQSQPTALSQPLNRVVVHRCETPPKPQPPEPPHSGEGMASIIRRLQ